MPRAPKESPDREVLKAFEAAGLVEYMEYLQSGRRIMLTNFKAGVAKGLGLTLGMSVVLGGLVWVLTMLVDLPLIGEYANDAVQYVDEYKENSNYKEEFSEMNTLLREIKENTEQVVEK